MSDFDDDIELDELIEQISVDAYGDEGYWSFLQALTDEPRHTSTRLSPWFADPDPEFRFRGRRTTRHHNHRRQQARNTHRLAPRHHHRFIARPCSCPHRHRVPQMAGRCLTPTCPRRTPPVAAISSSGWSVTGSGEHVTHRAVRAPGPPPGHRQGTLRALRFRSQRWEAP